MKTLIYKIHFLSDWHCGSGLSAGADVDTLCIKDENNLPFVPGKTIKGLLREAAEVLFGENDTFVKECFGKATKKEKTDEEVMSEKGNSYFSNVELTQTVKKDITKNNFSAALFRSLSSTKIDDKGIAVEHSLRKMQVAIPLTLYGEITDIPNDEYKDKLIKCMKYTKRIGVNRNRGLGRCNILEVEYV